MLLPAGLTDFGKRTLEETIKLLEDNHINSMISLAGFAENAFYHQRSAGIGLSPAFAFRILNCSMGRKRDIPLFPIKPAAAYDYHRFWAKSILWVLV